SDGPTRRRLTARAGPARRGRRTTRRTCPRCVWTSPADPGRRFLVLVARSTMQVPLRPKRHCCSLRSVPFRLGRTTVIQRRASGAHGVPSVSKLVRSRSTDKQRQRWGSSLQRPERPHAHVRAASGWGHHRRTRCLVLAVFTALSLALSNAVVAQGDGA